MSEFPCNTCTLKNMCGQARTLGKQNGVYICGDYVPVRCCPNCVHDGKQLVERKCIDCNIGTDCLNFEART